MSPSAQRWDDPNLGAMVYPMTSTTLERLAEDYRALRDAAAVVDLGTWTALEIVGSETRAFLQGTGTQDFELLKTPGTAARTLFLNEKGRPVAHAWVAFAPAPENAGSKGAHPDTAWILSDPGAATSLGPHLDRLRIMEDVEFRGPDQMPTLLGVAGPERDPLAHAIASKIAGSALVRAEPLSFVLLPAEVDSAQIPPAVDPRAFEAWRIRVGIPYQGIDFDVDRIATELSLPEAISMTKGCYVGQEVVARTANRGKVRRERIGFRFTWNGEPIPRGTKLRTGGLECGHVTSTAWEPGSSDGLGMGYLAPDSMELKLDILAIQGEKTTRLSLHSWPL